MTNADFETLGPIGLAAMLLIFGTFFFTLYLMGKEKRKLMFAISFLILPSSYLDMALEFSPNFAYRSWSHIPFMIAFTIAMSERLLPKKLDFNKLFIIFLVFSFVSMGLIPLKIFGMAGAVHVLTISISTICSIIIVVSLSIQIFKFKDPIVIIGIPAILSLMGGGFLLAMGQSQLFFLAHYFAFFLIIPILIFATGKNHNPGRGLKSYFSLNEQLKVAQDDLERSEEKFRMTFNNAKESMIWMNKDGRIIKYNRSAKEMFQPLSLNGLDLYALFVKEEREATYLELRDELGKKKNYEGEFVIRIGKRNIPVIITAVNTNIKGDMITQFIITDISTRKGFEQKLQESNRKLVDANSTLAHNDKIKTEFISILSHDIINPLVATKGQLELMKEGVFGNINDEQKETIMGIMKNLDRINNLRRDTLEITRLGSGYVNKEITKTDVNGVIDNTLDLIRSTPQAEGFEFIITPIPSLIVECNPKAVERALENLLSNSIRYSPRRTTIRVGANKTNGHVILYVKDQGRGIPKDDLEHIFESFYRTGERVEGSTGLGLSIVKGVAEGHGGRSWAESEGPGKGSTFFFEIPIVQK
jgi:PAS domain S-box-containing protein